MAGKEQITRARKR